MLVDSVTITVIGGRGGSGAATFRRDARTPKGGPDGGNGGRGGSIFFQGSKSINDLREFLYKKKIMAENGTPGSGNDRFGKHADDLTIFVPIGTQVINTETKETFEIMDSETRVLVARGGKYGRGNVAFKSATNQTPTEAEAGGPGEHKQLHLELRLIAEIGLIGLPNAGKSSLLAVLTNAKPIIGDYPFTTIEPNIGMMGTHAIADIPGLIEGASQGKGLGTKFLKHIEKTKLLVHCIDCSSASPKKDYETVRQEFAGYNAALLEKPELILLTKTDIMTPEEIQIVEKEMQTFGRKIVKVSVYDDQAIAFLRDTLVELLPADSVDLAPQT